MSKLTCEHCAKRVERGSHFVCEGKSVQGATPLLTAHRDTVRSYADWGKYLKASKA